MYEYLHALKCWDFDIHNNQSFFCDPLAEPLVRQMFLSVKSGARTCLLCSARQMLRLCTTETGKKVRGIRKNCYQEK